MSHIALYREWRPQTFSDVVAQNQVIFPLKQSIINGNIGHAYLFSGTRGTGKTSTAKIFAKAVNCLNPQNGDPCNACEICQAINDASLLDVMEIDAASNNSVDNIRRIIEEVVFMPTRAKYKVYIIDEVHMLSAGAFNALLKTLEEPPAHVIFILATTEPHRIPPTVLSRCLRFDFRRIAKEDIIGNLKMIARNENIDIEDSALAVISQLSDGAMRDAISLLDQAKSGIKGQITDQKLFDMVGIVQDQFLLDITHAIYQADLQEVLDLLNQMVMSGKDLERFVGEYARFLRNLLVTQITGNLDEWFGFSQDDLKDILNLSRQISSSSLLSWIEELSKLSSELRYVSDIRVAIEITFIKLMNSLKPIGVKVSESPLASAGLPENSRLSEDSVQPANFATDKFIALEDTEAIEDAKETKVIDDVKKLDTTKNIEKINESAKAEKEESVSEIEIGIHEESAQDVKVGKDIPSPSSTSISDQKSKKIWDDTLVYLMENGHMALKMLLSPAIIECKQDSWHISFSSDLKAHYQTVADKDNVKVIQDALQKTANNTNIKLHVEISNETETNENLNASEPQWIKDVRKMAKDLNIPIEMEE